MEKLGLAVEILFLAVFLGILPAEIARSKGRNFGTWWLYGFVLFIPAVIHALVMKPHRAGVKKTLYDGIADLLWRWWPPRVKTLHDAAAHNAHETAVRLIISGADVNEKNEYGTTPLQIAIANGAHETAALLRKHGATE